MCTSVLDRQTYRSEAHAMNISGKLRPVCIMIGTGERLGMIFYIIVELLITERRFVS